MKKEISIDKEKIESGKKIHDRLQSDCSQCFGFCCVALYFSKQDGFPNNKKAGQPCSNLKKDFSCKVHDDLKQLGYRGCLGYDCYGAGQKTAQICYGGKDWIKHPDTAKQMYDVFLIVRELHEFIWYLEEALEMIQDQKLKDTINDLILRMEHETQNKPEQILTIDVNQLWYEVRDILVNVSLMVRGKEYEELKLPIKYKRDFAGRADLIGKDLRKANLKCANLRGACLIAANLSNADLEKADLLGADFRDAIVYNADLSKCLFVTQTQLNTAKGNKQTKIPKDLMRPLHWVD